MIVQKSPEFQNLEQKFNILLNKFEQQININNYILANIDENQKNILKITKNWIFLTQKLNVILLKISSLNMKIYKFVRHSKIIL